MKPNDSGRLDIIMHPVIDQRAAPYLVRLGAALRSQGVQVRRLRAPELLRRGPLVLHVNWPEHIVRANEGGVKAVVKAAEAAVIAAVLTVRRDIRVVWTAHNLEPHDGWGGPIERWLFWALRRRVVEVVLLVPGHDRSVRETYPDLADRRFTTIEPRSNVTPSGAPIPERSTRPPTKVLMIGAIAPYKQQLEITRALRPFIESGAATLDVVGPVGDADYLAAVRVAAPDQGFSVVDRWVSDEELDDIIRAHHVVIAPQLHAFNTGVPYVTLPAGVPVVLSPSRQADWLIESQGDDFVRVLPDDGDAEAMRSLLDWALAPRSASSPGPWDWATSAEQHRAIYERALAG